MSPRAVRVVPGDEEPVEEERIEASALKRWWARVKRRFDPTYGVDEHANATAWANRGVPPNSPPP